MAVSVWLIWREGGLRAHAAPLGIFLAQLILNALWSPLFFGLKNPGLAFAEIVLLWLAIVVTVISFWRVEQFAGWLLAPYLAWVSFAAFLNFTLWQMNR